MADQGDGRLPFQNIKKKPRKIKRVINWRKIDEELRFAHKKKVENSQKPSMWEYNPKGGVPAELVNLDSSTFLTNRLGRDLCFLPKDVLVRICSMLSALDFVDLSLTCRVLHWRMFSFCTCYAPYTVQMRLQDNRISLDRENTSLKRTYRLYKDVVYDEDDFNSFGFKEGAARRPLLGKRGIFICQPFGLRKPFLFDTLELQLNLPFYRKTYYDRCLPYIMAVRNVVRHLHLTFVDHYCPGNRLFNFPETNDFLKKLNTSYCNVELPTTAVHFAQWSFRNIYRNCPYARQMYRVAIHRSLYYTNVPAFENSIGIYRNPLDSPIKATLENFLTGSTNLTFHQYIGEYNSRFQLIEYLFEKFGEFEEFLCVPRGRYNTNRYYHVWKKMVATENGELLRIMFDKRLNRTTHVRIGKEEMFEEMDKKYATDSLYQKGKIWWKMETAIEPEKDEETEEVEDLEEFELQDGPPIVCRFCSIL